MKKFLVIGPIVMMALLSCSKDKSNNGGLEGQWELRRASGMIVINYPPGDGQTIKFTANAYEIRNKDGQVTQSGAYSLVKDADAGASTCLVIPEGTYTERIDFTGDHPGRKVYFQLSNDSLFLLSGCFALDAGSREEYVRK